MSGRALLISLAAACASMPSSEYVPGGEGLPGSARVAYRLALERERNGDLPGALAIFAQLCTEHPLRISFHLRRVRLARARMGSEAAAALYEPPPPGVDAERAGIFAQFARIPEEDLAGRKTVLEFAAEREPTEPYWRLAMADVEVTAHQQLVERARTERGLGRAQAAAVTDVEAGAVLDRARQLAEAALSLDAGFAEAHVLLGYIGTALADLQQEMEQRDHWRAVADGHYTDALALDPGSLPALLNRAENHLYFDRYAEAAKDLRRAAELAPRQPLVWTNLGYTHYALGQLGPAVASYREALLLEPADARARTALSDCLRRQGDMEGAVGELERARDDAAEDRPLRAEIAFKLAAIHEYERRYAEAVQQYEAHIELGGRDAAKARSRIRHIYESAYE